MRVRIGNQTSASASLVMQPFEYAMAHGFAAFEWFPDKKISGEGWTEEDISKETRRAIKEAAQAKDISLSVHAPLPSHLLKSSAEESFARGLEFALDIGASLFNIHFDPGSGIGVYAESILPLIEILSQRDIRLSLENTIDTAPEDFNELFTRLGALPLPDISSVGMCLDIGHANLCRRTKNDYLKYVDLLDSHVPIIHLHMHENYGDFDSHLTVFTGPSAINTAGIEGLIKRLEDREFSGSIIFEQWPQPPELLDNARKRLIEIIGDSNEINRKYPQDFADEIAMANQTFLSWRQRLEWILRILNGPDDIDLEHLVYLAVYLRFIGNGEVGCEEDTGHHRPSNHARISNRIYSRLKQLTTPENAFVVRKIYPWLPSFDSPFMRSEPLTRIRDIAHRNDIPQDLKKEIKVTLQNKLHRSAGPEDLVTSGAILKKITDPNASYSPAFIKEFRLFHDELREFFNARSLEEQLESLMEEKSIRGSTLIRDFLKSKNNLDGPEKTLAVLSLMTKLRSSLAKRQTGSIDSFGQRLRIIDIGLEDFSFVLLSRLSNYFDVSQDDLLWGPALHSLSLTVGNLRLGGFDHDECEAIESELKTWAEDFKKSDRDNLLRVKATLDRCRRLADDYSDKILALFPDKVEQLGHSLGVTEHAIKAFVEGGIRNHPVFQLSKFVAMLLKRIRSLAALPPWEVIVPGKAYGFATASPVMSKVPMTNPDKQIIAVLDMIHGDEDIPHGISGIVVGHDTPFLSHFAVRARGRKIVFVSCEDKDLFSELKGLAGREVILDASSDKVALKIYKGGESGEDDNLPWERFGQCSAVLLSPRAANILSLDEVTLETGGNKAYGARRLRELSSGSTPVFRTPPGVVVPFGVMEDALQSFPDLEREYSSIVAGLDDMKDVDLSVSLRRLREIVGSLELPQNIEQVIIHGLGHNERLIVRSSSNCEDGYNLSGAGVYDSIVNVEPHRIADAVRTVWASLWNENAVIGRRYSGISHSGAHMAVLIQHMVVPEYSFIIHTLNPSSNDPSEILIECAVGLGETIASGETPGSPFRLIYDKVKENVQTLAFASFSTMVVPGPEGKILRKTIDYASVGFSTDTDLRNSTGMLLGQIGRFMEDALGRPEDIEGLISGGSVFLVQARPQKGLT